MPKQKFYAIKTPEGGQVVETWSECEKRTHGVKGVLYKAFATRDEAENWISGMSAPVPEGLRIYVDGSFTPGFDRAGWAFIVVDGDVEVARGSGITAFVAESRNIDGEVMASYQAMKWLETNDRNAVICHDYEGVARWAKGEWQAKSHIAKQYVAAVRPFVHRVLFEKVAAHTGVKWNEAVDQLAKDAIARAKKIQDSEKKGKDLTKHEVSRLGTSENESPVQAQPVTESAPPLEMCLAKNPLIENMEKSPVPASKKAKPSRKASPVKSQIALDL